MRTARLVMASILLGVAALGAAQERAQAPKDARPTGDVDREITVKGQDETALPVPAPAVHDRIALPDVDMERPDLPSLPPILPPAGAGVGPFPEWRVRDPAGASPS